MPNWCEGNIRLRGNSATIKDFLRNEFVCTGYRKFPDGLESQPMVIEETSYGEVTLKVPQNMENTAFCSIHIKGTRRNFIDQNEIYVYLDEEDECNVIVIDNFKAAWGVDSAPYLEKAKKYGIDIRIVGVECGMEFVQDIEIVGGEIVKDHEIKYDDWMWECPMPNMGG